jgi:cell division septation protein DedD
MPVVVSEPQTRVVQGARGDERILPRHLVEERRHANAVRMPKGYVQVWEDGRLNPKRGEQSVNGYIRSQQTWTKTVPRQLTTAGQVVVKQPRIVGTVTTQAPPPPVIATRQSQPKAPAAAKTPRSAGAIYVQLGMFGVPDNATRSAQRMSQTGYPTRIGTLNRGGKTYRLVMAGPFASRADAQQALTVARRIGFTDAYLR